MESARPSVFTKSNDEGVERVKNSKRMYAFLMESTPLEYVTDSNCGLTQIGGLLDTKGYGIAMPVSKCAMSRKSGRGGESKWQLKFNFRPAIKTDSPYRTQISGAVLKMQEDGRLQALKHKWWRTGEEFYDTDLFLMRFSL